MRAAIVRAVNTMAIEDVDVDAPGPLEVLVRTVAAGVCHSDLSVMTGRIRASFPLVLGHESAGVVEEVGSLVSYVKPGDRVVTCLPAFCGQCEYCLSGRPSLCQQGNAKRPAGQRPRLTASGQELVQLWGLGSFAECLLVDENAVVKIADAMPLDRAALLGCGVTTGLGAAINTAGVPVGASVAVFGCGGVGLSVVQGARLSGAARIIAVDRVPARLETARQLGATHVVNAASYPAVECVLALTDGAGVDYSFEAVGAKETTEQAFAVLKRGGTATVVGVIQGQTIEVPGDLLMSERKLQGCVMGSNRFRMDIPRYVDLYLQGRLRLDEIITSRITLDLVGDAFDAMTRGEGVRSVIVFA